MTAHAPPGAVSPARHRRPAAWAGVLTAGACLLAAGCSAGSQPKSSSGPVMGAAHAPAKSAAVAGPVPAAAGRASGPAGGGQAAKSLDLTALAPLGQSVIFTAGLTVKAANVQTAVTRATSVVAAAGGYVSAEHTSLSRSRSARPRVSIQFKIPVGSYQATLATLGGLGRRLSESQRAQDVTQTVADVSSRVTSAHAMITQLRRLLARAGSVGGLLSVQDQIGQEEATLEALQSQQRALANETTYATVSMVILGPSPAHHHRHHHRHKATAGFLGGLTAGWRALRAAVSVVLTIAGAVLPFAVILALAAAAAYAARRRLARRKTGTSPAQ